MEKTTLDILKENARKISINIKTSREFRDFVYEKEDLAIRNRLSIYLYSIDIKFNFYPLSIEDLLYFYVGDPTYRDQFIENENPFALVDERRLYSEIENNFLHDLKQGCFDYIIKVYHILLYDSYSESKNKSWSNFLYKKFSIFNEHEFLSKEEREYLNNMKDLYSKYKLYGYYNHSINDIFDLPSYVLTSTDNRTDLENYKLFYQEPEHIPQSYEEKKVYEELSIDGPTKSFIDQLEYPDRDRIIITEKIDGYVVSLFKLNNKLYPLKKDGSLIKYIKNDQYGNMEDNIYSKFIDYIMFYKTKFLNLLENEECVSFVWLIKKHIIPYKSLSEPIVGIDIISFKNGKKKHLPFDDIKLRFEENFIRTPRILYDTKTEIFIEWRDEQNDMFGENSATYWNKPLKEVNDSVIHENIFGVNYRYERDGEFLRNAQFIGEFLTYYPQYEDNEFSRRNWWSSPFAPSINGRIDFPIDSLSL